MPFQIFMGDDANEQVETLRDVKRGIDEARGVRADTARIAAESVAEMKRLLRCVCLLFAGCSAMVAVVLVLILMGH